MSKSNELVLRPIGELLNESFFIPAYQRGYRWNKRQVVNLLDDIKEFQQQSEEGSKDAFYCLQPVVVKNRGEEWELVDGQQRLTTIYIILNFLKDIAAQFGVSCYEMRYETRETSAEFLNEIDESRCNDNIDFSHICEAKDAIVEWFAKQPPMYKLKFLQTLLNDNDTGKNVKVIWYQVNEQVDATAIFSRLNIGKISLTNAELIKALFLRSSNFFGDKHEELHLHQLKIAQEWDSIEKQLQDDEFWYFISNTAAESNRIDFVLRLAANEFSDNETSSRDPLFTFLAFNQRFSNLDCQAEDEWLLVKRYFMTLHEWFNDRVLFHLVGFLICQQENVATLMALSGESESRQAFRLALVERAYKKAFPGFLTLDRFENFEDMSSAVTEQLEQLTYKSGRSRLLPVLLLFNVASLLANPKTNSRFQFNRFKSEAWDIEHIRSVASEMPGSKEKQKAWLENVVQYISSVDEIAAEEHLGEKYIKAKKVRNSAVELLGEKKFDSSTFVILYDEVIRLYDPKGDDEIDQSIGNLTLLDSSTNRSYQNAVFPIKRDRIISLDKSATFVPLCTKNAFLKYYSQHVDKMMYWEPKDSQDHQAAMTNMLVNFFDGLGVSL